MFKLDDNLLIELGLGSLPPQEKNRMLNHIYETLEMRVGMKLAQRMTNQQLDEFEGFIDRSDEAGALKWLETNFPDYKQVVSAELDSLKSEIKAAAPQIVAASQQQSALGPQQPPMGAVTSVPNNAYQPQAMAPPSFNQPEPQMQAQFGSPQTPFQAVPPQPAQSPATFATPAPLPQQPMQPATQFGQVNLPNATSPVAPPTPLVPTTDPSQSQTISNPINSDTSDQGQGQGAQISPMQPPIQ